MPGKGDTLKKQSAAADIPAARKAFPETPAARDLKYTLIRAWEMPAHPGNRFYQHSRLSAGSAARKISPVAVPVIREKIKRIGA